MFSEDQRLSRKHFWLALCFKPKPLVNPSEGMVQAGLWIPGQPPDPGRRQLQVSGEMVEKPHRDGGADTAGHCGDHSTGVGIHTPAQQVSNGRRQAWRAKEKRPRANKAGLDPQRKAGTSSHTATVGHRVPVAVDL